MLPESDSCNMSQKVVEGESQTGEVAVQLSKKRETMTAEQLKMCKMKERKMTLLYHVNN